PARPRAPPSSPTRRPSDLTQQIRFAARAPARGIEREAVEHVARHLLGQAGFVGDLAEAVEGRIGGWLVIEGAARQHAQGVDPMYRRRFVFAAFVRQGQFAATPAPGIEQPGFLARRTVETLAGERKAAAAADDDLTSAGNE